MSHSDDDLIGTHHPYFSQFDIASGACAGLSALGSITIVLTGVLFPGLWKKKIYMQMVMMGAVCDFLGSLGAAFGFPLNDALCKWQSHMTMFFLRASYVWILFITLKLYMYMKYNWDGLNMLEMQLICWSFSVLMQSMPMLDGVSMGGDDETAGYQPCVFHKYHLKSGYSVGDVWFTCVWFVPKLLIIALLVFMVAGMWEVKWAQLQAAYPFALSVMSFPNIIMSAIENYGQMTRDNFGTTYILVNITYCWDLLYGLAMAVIFWRNSIEARRRWQLALVELGCVSRPSTPLVKADTSSGTRTSHDESNASTDSRQTSSDSSNTGNTLSTGDVTFLEHEIRASMGGDILDDIDFDMSDFDTYRMPFFRRLFGWRTPPDTDGENNNGGFVVKWKRKENGPMGLDVVQEEL